jgi:hypothetical protein
MCASPPTWFAGCDDDVDLRYGKWVGLLQRGE